MKVANSQQVMKIVKFEKCPPECIWSALMAISRKARKDRNDPVGSPASVVSILVLVAAKGRAVAFVAKIFMVFARGNKLRVLLKRKSVWYSNQNFDGLKNR